MEAFGKHSAVLPGILGATRGGSRTYRFLAFQQMLAMPFSLECMACFVIGCQEYLQKETISGYWQYKVNIKYDPTKRD